MKKSTIILLKLVIILLIVINVVLFFFLKLAKDEQIKSILGKNWQRQNYPEILQIKDSNWDFQKLTQFFQNLAGQKGGEYAYHALAMAAQKRYLTPDVDTHLLGHSVGDVLYKQKGIDGIKVCTDDLRNACSHSIVVGFLLEHGQDSLKEAVSACHDAPGGKGAYTMCVHGLGHGVLGYTEYDMRRAVALCEKTGTKEYKNQEVGQCIGGVTMEMMAGVHDREAWLKQTPNYFKDNDPLAPCSNGFISKEYLSFCYMYLTPNLFKAAGADLRSPDSKDFKKAMSYCENIPKDDSNRRVCFASFGKEYTIFANARNVQSVEDMNKDQLILIYNWCSSGGEEALPPCLNSALQSLYWGGENDPGVSIRFCGVIPDKQHADECVKNLINLVSYFFKNDNSYKDSFCKVIPKEYREDCNLKLFIKTR